MRFIGLALTALLAVASAVSVPFTSCGTGSFTAKAVDVNPFPPSRGKSVKITTQGHLASQITGGKFEVDVSLAGITLLKQNGDMCKFSPDLACPQQPGDVTAGYTMDVPIIAPNGKYDIVFHGSDQDGKVVFCIQSQFEIKSLWEEAVVEVLPANIIEPMTSVPFSNCGAGDLQISAVDVTPFPPVRGQATKIIATGNLASQVTAGTFDVEVQLAGITVLKQSGDLCKFSPDVICPRTTGPISVSYSINVPSIAPNGKYTILFKGTQQDKKDLFCVSSNFEIKSTAEADRYQIDFEQPSTALVPVPSPVPFSTCEAGTFTVTSVDTTPFPPVRGKSVKIVASGTLAEQITAGTFEVDVSLGGITLLKNSGDICKFSADVKCPTAPGALTVSYNMDVPIIAPNGQYVIKFKGVQQDGKTAFCVTSNFELKSTWMSNVYSVAFPKPQPSPAALVAVNTAVPFTNCGNGDFVVTAVDVSPWPPAKGKDVKIIATGNLKSQVTAGNFEVDVSLLGITVLKKSGDLCKFSPDVKCPTASGALTLSYTMNVPAIAPAGTYQISFKGTQQDAKSLFCVQSTFQL
jgi:hypothetical protein